MKEKPILFSGPMVRAILDGRKTQTRRVVNSRGMKLFTAAIEAGECSNFLEHGKHQGDDRYLSQLCPYGAPGDRLWVRETWTQSRVADSTYPHMQPPDEHIYKDALYWRSTYGGSNQGIKWRPSIHMPRWASQITLEVKAVRVERVQDIRDQDVLKEGIRCVTKDGDVKKYCVYDKGDYCSVPWCDMPRVPRDAFRKLWIDCGYDWGRNPWVWVVEFELDGRRHETNPAVAGENGG